MLKERYLSNYILEDLREKMVFVGGPRQVGKTTLAQDIIGKKFKNPIYFNWDERVSRQMVMQGNWSKENDLIIFDEIHKYRKWKRLVKGYYDTQKQYHAFLVSGSARLDIYRKGSDSLQGRYHYYRCHPFTIAELLNKSTLPKPFSNFINNELVKEKEVLSTFHKFGGFPEPLLKQSEKVLRRFHNEKIERLFREEINEQEQIRDLQSMKLLSDILPAKVGALFSLNNLTHDIDVSYTALSRWINLLESYYYLFRIYPFQGKHIRSLKKESKMYLWDWSEVNDESARFENMVASHLLKLVHLLYDCEGYKAKLYYIRDRDQREVDFLVTIGEKPWFAVEVKLNDTDISKNLTYFQQRLNIPYAYQVILKQNVIKKFRDASVISADVFLQSIV